MTKRVRSHEHAESPAEVKRRRLDADGEEDVVLIPTVPHELLFVIAEQGDARTFAALLALPPFARAITEARREFFMELYGPHETYTTGVTRIYRCGLLHCRTGPAYVWPGVSTEWYANGRRHREDGPAFVNCLGEEEWWLNGKRHREDGPARVDFLGVEEWWLNGERHREDGPAILDTPDGSEEWWVHGEKQVGPPT